MAAALLSGAMKPRIGRKAGAVLPKAAAAPKLPAPKLPRVPMGGGGGAIPPGM